MLACDASFTQKRESQYIVVKNTSLAVPMTGVYANDAIDSGTTTLQSSSAVLQQ